MKFEVRKFLKEDKTEIVNMMENFYSSDAVYTNGSAEIFENDFNACLNSQYLEGYIFQTEGVVFGYAMLAKSFSTEFGKECIWFEDLYLKPKYRNKHIIPKFVDKIKSIYPNALFRIEAEKENLHALYVYKKCGFEELPYIELKL